MLQKIVAMRGLRWGLLPSLITVGVVGGYIAHEAFLAPYRAHVVVDLADVQSFKHAESLLRSDESVVQSFKRAESLLRSDENVERFAEAHGLEQDPAIVDFIDQLSLGQNNRLSWTFRFR